MNTPPVSGAVKISEIHQRALNRRNMRSRDWETADGFLLRVSEFSPPERPPLFFAAVYGPSPERAALIRVVRDSQCRLRGAERIETAHSPSAPAPQRLAQLDAAFSNRARPTPLNPKLPQDIEDRSACTPVAMIDNGVNYLLPEIYERLATTEDKQLLGFDFWENDPLPFDFGVPDGDLDPRISAFEPISHGTSVASVLLNDAADPVCLAPFRYAPHKPNRDIGHIIDDIATSGVRIIVLSTGRLRPWPAYQAGMLKHPEILFVSAAGNEGVDLTRRPLFPMAYAQDNHLVVAAANPDGSVWGRSNTGSGLVEIAVPAVEVPGLEFSGRDKLLTGTSFAAPRVAALAAQIHVSEQGLSGAALKQAVLSAVAQKGHVSGPITSITETQFQEVLSKTRAPQN